MPRKASKFTKSEITRAAKAAKAAGLDIVGIDIDRDGTIHIIAGKPASSVAANDSNEWQDAQPR